MGCPLLSLEELLEKMGLSPLLWGPSWCKSQRVQASPSQPQGAQENCWDSLQTWSPVGRLRDSAFLSPAGLCYPSLVPCAAAALSPRRVCPFLRGGMGCRRNS